MSYQTLFWLGNPAGSDLARTGRRNIAWTPPLSGLSCLQLLSAH